MSRFCTFVSSSKGNCAYLAGGGTALLIDAGCSCRAIRRELGRLSCYGDKLSGIVITHEHTDHINGLRVLLRGLEVPVCGSPGTLEALARMGSLPPGATLIDLSGPVELGGIGIRAFAIPHDAADPVGLRFSLPDGRSVGVATDLGHVTQTVADSLAGCDLLLLESNYDPGMLGSGPYPWSLKRRIAGKSGHLSNDESALLAQSMLSRGTTRFLLGHLSVNNNYPAIAYQAARAALEEEGAQEGRDYLLSIAPPYQPHPMVVF